MIPIIIVAALLPAILLWIYILKKDPCPEPTSWPFGTKGKILALIKKDKDDYHQDRNDMFKRRVFVLLFTISILSIASPADAVTHRALVFGLGKQEDTSWGKIHGDNDVHYVVQLLHQMGYTDIKTLKNEQATKQAMADAFVGLANRCQKGDVVYIHYSGHGQLMTDVDGDDALKWNNSHSQWDEAWIPYDAYMVYGPNDRGEKHFCDDEVGRGAGGYYY